MNLMKINEDQNMKVPNETCRNTTIQCSSTFLSVNSKLQFFVEIFYLWRKSNDIQLISISYDLQENRRNHNKKCYSAHFFYSSNVRGIFSRQKSTIRFVASVIFSRGMVITILMQLSARKQDPGIAMTDFWLKSCLTKSTSLLIDGNFSRSSRTYEQQIVWYQNCVSLVLSLVLSVVARLSPYHHVHCTVRHYRVQPWGILEPIVKHFSS